MSKIKIKICGLTRVIDAEAAVAAGADAIGVIFAASSKRRVSITTAQQIAKVLPPFVALVGVFADNSVGQIKQVLSKVPLTHLQFHGAESPAFCR